MTDTTWTDKSGEPRSLRELEETLIAVKKAIIQFDISSPLTIHLTVIKDALVELIAIRKASSKLFHD